jgi:excisionase family DNA binding protein
MDNYAKPGYSTKEVAQILGCTPCTVRHMIESGRMKGRVSNQEVIPGKKRKIRIFREDLANYIYEHRGQFDKALVQQFSKYRTGYPKPDDRSMRVTDTDPQDKEVKVNENGDTSVPTGAWANLLNATDTDRAEQEYKEAIKGIKAYAEKEPVKSERAASYMVLVNGRIAVGNVTVDTAKIIAGALLADDICEVEAVEIRKMKKGGDK